MTLETRLPWDVLGALPETFLTASGSLEPLDLIAGQTLLLRGATSSLGIACLELARAAGVRVVATTRTEGKARRLAERGAGAVVIERAGFVERARAELPDAGADGVVDLIGGRAVLDSLALVRRGGTVCNSGLLGGEWVIDDFQPLSMIPSGRKLTAYQSEDAADGSVSGPLLRAVVEQVELGTVDPGIDRVYSIEEIKDAHRRMAAGEATGKLVVVTGTPA
jgi:NADPH:quinone reductase-like Zn-dependent oxidoreductase